MAIDLQNDLAQHSEALNALGLLTTGRLKADAPLSALTPGDLRQQWNIIANLNYLPVIVLARDCLDLDGLLGAALPDVLASMDRMVGQIAASQAKHVYNFAGELWQELVVDREERAAHYTRPPIAELLSTLSAARFSSLPPSALKKVNLMDAACGTGTLIGAGERALRRLYTMRGGRDRDLHRVRMEDHIYAFDVNGIAGTLTAKRLTDLQVEENYQGGKIAIIDDPAGSLVLMNPGNSGVSVLLAYRDVTEGIDGGGSDIPVPNVGMHWALMNPPYSRARKDRQQATRTLQPLRLKARREGFAMAHGQAGLGSDFGDLSNIRLCYGGVLAHVLPQTAAHGQSWTRWRAGLEKDFEQITVIGSAAAELESMSADTDNERDVGSGHKAARGRSKRTETTSNGVEAYGNSMCQSACDTQDPGGGLCHRPRSHLDSTGSDTGPSVPGKLCSPTSEPRGFFMDCRGCGQYRLHRHWCLSP